MCLGRRRFRSPVVCCSSYSYSKSTAKNVGAEEEHHAKLPKIQYLGNGETVCFAIFLRSSELVGGVVSKEGGLGQIVLEKQILGKDPQEQRGKNNVSTFLLEETISHT